MIMSMHHIVISPRSLSKPENHPSDSFSPNSINQRIYRAVIGTLTSVPVHADKKERRRRGREGKEGGKGKKEGEEEEKEGGGGSCSYLFHSSLADVLPIHDCLSLQLLLLLPLSSPLVGTHTLNSEL